MAKDVSLQRSSSSAFQPYASALAGVSPGGRDQVGGLRSAQQAVWCAHEPGSVNCSAGVVRQGLASTPPARSRRPPGQGALLGSICYLCSTSIC